VDVATNLSTSDLQSALKKLAVQNLQMDEFHPDAWQPAIVGDPSTTLAALQAVAGDKYTYRDLDDFTDTIQRSLKTLPIVAKAERSGGTERERISEFLAGAPGAIQAQARRPSETPCRRETCRSVAKHLTQADAWSAWTPQANSRASTICAMWS